MSNVDWGEKVISSEMSVLIWEMEASEVCDRARMFWRRVRRASYCRASIIPILRAFDMNI